MRFAAPLSLWLSWAVVAFAQTNNTYNAISIPSGASTLQITANQPYTLKWTDPSSGTVTIKLQQTNITPDSGVVLASGIQASAEQATFTIPAAANSADYTIEIIDDTDPSQNINFSPPFAVSGATGVGTALLATSTGSASASASGSSASGSSMSTITGSSASASSASASSGSASSASASSASGSSASSASSAAASTSAAASSASPTSAPTSNAAVPVRIPGGILAAIVGGVALL